MRSCGYGLEVLRLEVFRSNVSEPCEGPRVSIIENCPGFAIDDAKSAQTDALSRGNRRTRVEPNMWFTRDQRIFREARVT